MNKAKRLKQAFIAALPFAVVAVLTSGNCLPTQKWATKGVFCNRPFENTLDNNLAKTLVEQGNSLEKSVFLIKEADKKPLDNALMTDLTKQAAELSVTDRSQLLGLRGSGDELDSLAGTVNALLD